MADINKLKDKIKSTIYPNGKGAINASDHQAMLLDMADGMAETDTKLTELSANILRFSTMKEVQGSGSGHRLAYWLLGNPKGNVIRVSAIKGDVGNNLVSIYRSANGTSVVPPVLQTIQFGEVAEVAYDAENPYIYVYTPYDFSQDMTFLVEIGVKGSLEESLDNLEESLEEKVDNLEESLGAIKKFAQKILIKSPREISFSQYIPAKEGMIINLVPTTSHSFAFFSIYKAKDDQNTGLIQILGKEQFDRDIYLPFDAEYPYYYIFGYNAESTSCFEGILNIGYRGSLEERVENLEQKSGLFGKTIVCLGDSITENKDNNGKSYSDYLAEELNAKVINIGVGGANLRQRSSNRVKPENFTTTSQAYLYLDVLPMAQSLATGDWDNAEAAANYIAANSSDDNREIVARAKGVNLQEVDIVTIFAGTNDFSANNLVWGEDDSTNPLSIKGAVNLIVESLLSANPRLKIVFFTPIVRYLNSIAPENWSDVFEVTSEYRPEAATKNYFLYDIETKIQEACRHNHIPCCAWYWTLGWNKINFMQYFVAPDGTHPKNGYDYIGKKMATFLKSNL